MTTRIKKQPFIICLMGPTASGKTRIAVALKKQDPKNIEIISVDSGSIYKGMNIGTSKPSLSELIVAPHKLIDIRDPAECYSVADFYYDAVFEIRNIIKSGRIPLLVGGTMLYFKVLLHGLFILPSANEKIRNNLRYEAQKVGWMSIYNKLKYIDPIAAHAIHWNDHKRIIRALEVFFISGKTWTELKKISVQHLKYKIYNFAVMPLNRDSLNKNIEWRFYRMLDMGFENEVATLFARSDLHNTVYPSISCVGYRQMWEYLSGSIDYNRMILKGISASRKLAKQQLTWLRVWSNLNWIDSTSISKAVANISKILRL